MALRISGPGIGLPLARGVRPARRFAGLPAYSPPTNWIDLQGGQVLMIPPGNWIVRSAVGNVASQLEFLDPQLGFWRLFYAADPAGWSVQLFSDGFNYRVLNTAQTGTEASVTAPGSGYVQATTTVTPSAGNSVWHPIIGGALGNLTLVNPGANYSIPPLVFIPAPPAPGVPARAVSTLAADGTIASLTLRNAGAGYKQAPVVSLIESPNEPNRNEINFALAQATVEVVGAGTLTHVTLENFGAPLPAPPTLTIAGSGTGAAASVLPATWVAPSTDEIFLQPAAG